MRKSSLSTARRLFVTLIAAPVLVPAFALADEAASLDHADAPAPLELTTPQRIAGPDIVFERQFGPAFFRDYWSINPERAISAGQFEFADRTAVLDSRARALAIGKLNEWLSQLHRFDPRTLNPSNRTDWWLLNNTFEAERWALTEYRAWEWNPALYNATTPIEAILASDHAPLEQRLRSCLKRLNDVSTYYGTARRNLAQPTRQHTLLAIDSNREGLKLLGPALEQRIAASGLRDSEKALFTRRIAAARIAIQEYVAWLDALEDQALPEGTAPHPMASLDAPAAPAAPASAFPAMTTDSTQEPSLVRTYFGNNALTGRWTSRQARVGQETASNLPQSTRVSDQ